MNKLMMFFLSTSILLFGHVVHSDIQSVASDQLPNISNTNQQCVTLARAVLKQEPLDGVNSAPELIACLEGDYFYFDRGAAKIALSHIGEPAVPGLVQALNSGSVRIAEGAAIALGMIGPKAIAAVPALKDVLRTKPKPGDQRQREAAIALGKIGEVDFLIRALQGEEENISVYLVCEGLGAAGPAAAPAVPPLIELLHGADNAAQMYAANALGEIGPDANPAVPRLEQLSRSALNFVRRSAGEALVKIGTPEAKEAAIPYERRKKFIDGFFKSMSVFIAMPWLAAVVGIAMGVGAFLTARNKKSRKALLVPIYVSAVLWVVYSAWEFYCGITGANIRIDLFLIYPLLAIATIVSVVVWLIMLRRD